MLIEARESLPALHREQCKVLLAPVPVPYQGEKLVGTVEEMAKIGAVVPATTIIPLDATETEAHIETSKVPGVSAQMVLDHIPSATIVHFACHGMQDAQNPFRSGFLMADKQLYLGDILRLELPHAFMAFLSACETGKSDRMHPGDDGMHVPQFVNLAATMMAAGFKSVVATMW